MTAVNLFIPMKKAAFLIFCITFITTLHAQTLNRSSFVTDSLDNYINQALANWNIPGAAVCIVKDGKVVMMRGYGVKEMGKADKADENTLFMIGSNTKAFTATALAMLQAQGKLSLDDKVNKYLPDWRLNDKAVSDMAIVRDLLCHRLGFATFQGDFTFYNTNLSRSQVMEKMAYVNRLYPFRTKWGYTNSAFLTAGQIIPVVSGKAWEAYLKDNIFTPLGMDRTLALSADLPKATNKATPHTLQDGKLIPIPYCMIDGIAPAGSISSSVNDMSKWVMALLANGEVGSQHVIPAAAIRETRQPQDVVGLARHLNGFTSYNLYGLGFELQEYENHMLVMHTGGVNGFVSSVTLVPDQHLGIIVLTNNDQNAFYEALKWDIMDAYFKLPFQDYSNKYLGFYKTNQANETKQDQLLRDTVAMHTAPNLALNNYTGSYSNTLYGKATITKGRHNDLEMRFEHHPGLVARMQYLNSNRFYVVFSDPELGKAVFPFQVTDGKVTGVRVKVADFVEMTPYDFKKE